MHSDDRPAWKLLVNVPSAWEGPIPSCPHPCTMTWTTVPSPGDLSSQISSFLFFFFLMTIRMSVISLPRYGLTGRMVECDNRRATLADGRLHHGGSVPSGQVVHPNPNFVSTS